MACYFENKDETRHRRIKFGDDWFVIKEKEYDMKSYNDIINTFNSYSIRE